MFEIPCLMRSLRPAFKFGTCERLHHITDTRPDEANAEDRRRVWRRPRELGTVEFLARAQ